MTATKLRVMTDLIGRHCAHLRQRGLSDNTIHARHELLRRMDTELPMGLEEATVEELSNWLGREGWSRQTRATYYMHCKGFYDWACDPRDPHLDWNPAASLTRPKVPAGVPKPITDDELGAALAAAEGWQRIAIILCSYAGLRCCELASVERSDVNLHTITIIGKGGKVRVVPTHPLVWNTVRDLPPGRLIDGTPGQVSKALRDHFDRTGQPAVTAHRLRHWFATTALAAGADLLTVSVLLGHAGTRITVRYCQITDRQRATAVAALPVINHTPAPAR